MSSYFNKWNISSKWFQMVPAMKQGLWKDTNHRQALQKRCADFKGNHHLCGHRRSSVSLAGRSCLATGFQLYSSSRAWGILWQLREEHLPCMERYWEFRGVPMDVLIWQGCHNTSIFLSHIVWNSWGWQCQQWDTEPGSPAENQRAKETVPGLKGYSHSDLGKSLSAWTLI